MKNEKNLIKLLKLEIIDMKCLLIVLLIIIKLKIFYPHKMTKKKSKMKINNQQTIFGTATVNL